ncbi:hypothetical protein ACJMK2_028631 [Sinanodonta woodiana]|uniref:Uncharacterized protein n=1 Tax=Sinanodonta woodiana TaxID=1069815 RepID=A0ABD3X7P8_SINWO
MENSAEIITALSRIDNALNEAMNDGKLKSLALFETNGACLASLGSMEISSKEAHAVSRAFLNPISGLFQIRISSMNFVCLGLHLGILVGRSRFNMDTYFDVDKQSHEKKTELVESENRHVSADQKLALFMAAILFNNYLLIGISLYESNTCLKELKRIQDIIASELVIE